MGGKPKRKKCARCGEIIYNRAKHAKYCKDCSRFLKIS